MHGHKTNIMNQQQPQQALFFYPLEIVSPTHLVSVYENEKKYLSSESALNNLFLGIFENFLAKRLSHGDTIKELNEDPRPNMAFTLEVEFRWEYFSSLGLGLESMYTAWNSLFSKNTKFIVLG